MKRKIPKYIWMPTLLAIYLIAMAAYFAPNLIAAGEWVRLISVTVVDAAIIVILFLFLRKIHRRNNTPEE